jgi:Translation initiation factor IF-2, N-terminal region
MVATPATGQNRIKPDTFILPAQAHTPAKLHSPTVPLEVPEPPATRRTEAGVSGKVPPRPALPVIARAIVAPAVTLGPSPKTEDHVITTMPPGQPGRKVRIQELARELEVNLHEILELLPLYGVHEKKTYSSSIDEEVARRTGRSLIIQVASGSVNGIIPQNRPSLLPRSR